MPTNFPSADTTSPADTLGSNNPNKFQNIVDTVAAQPGSLTAAPGVVTGAVNALGTKTTTGTLKYGVNTVTGTSSDALVLTLPAAATGAVVICVFTNAASTAVTSLTFTGMKNAGGTEFACTNTASAVDVFGLISDGTNWYGWFSNKAVS